MDLKAVIDGAGEPWTEERHNSFLNWIEESFVRRMLGLDNDDDHGDFHGFTAPCYAVRSDRQTKLDRDLPDSATESTRDLRSPKGRHRRGRVWDLGLGSEQFLEGRDPITGGNVRRREVEPSETRNLATTSHESTKKRHLPQYDASQDQVVPQFGSTKEDSDNTHKHKKGRNQKFYCL